MMLIIFVLLIWAVLRDEQISNDKQKSNWRGVEHEPAMETYSSFFVATPFRCQRKSQYKGKSSRLKLNPDHF